MLPTQHTGQVITVHVPGEESVMANMASRPAKALAMFASTKSHLSDNYFRSSFDTAFTLPNNQEWKLEAEPEWLKYNVFKTLLGKQLDLQQWTVCRDKNTGRRGRGTASSTKQAAKQAPYRRKEYAPYLCCCRAGRPVWPRTSNQGSVSVQSSLRRRPKVRSGRTSRPTTILPSTTFT